MKPAYKIFFLIILFLQLFSREAHAVADPLAVPNNKFGVHILFTSELGDAARLVNSSGGDWGYVTIPIQAGDKDLDKWQKFMDEAKASHLIPIVRLATEGDYFKNSNWRKPEFTDILDFANFLDSLKWPTLNRYVVIFNEPNRADEWGGKADPSEYAEILSFSIDIFKSKNQNFFIISAGLDNAAGNNGTESLDQYVFMRKMYEKDPEVFAKIDAIASHSYPNPGFRQPPNVLTRKSISSFLHEKQLADSFGNKDLPVFITETGWSKDEVSQSKIASYYRQAFDSVWSDSKIVAVTPFLLAGGNGGFSQFSLTKDNGEKHDDYNAIKDIAKQEGKPILEKHDLTTQVFRNSQNSVFPTKDFSRNNNSNLDYKTKEKVNTATRLVKWLFKL